MYLNHVLLNAYHGNLFLPKQLTVVKLLGTNYLVVPLPKSYLTEPSGTNYGRDSWVTIRGKGTPPLNWRYVTNL